MSARLRIRRLATALEVGSPSKLRAAVLTPASEIKWLVLVSGGHEVRLPPGSYFSFTGRMPHATRCEAGADCILAIDSRGKWDVVPEKNAR
jgi:hypothetical protein